MAAKEKKKKQLQETWPRADERTADAKHRAIGFLVSYLGENFDWNQNVLVPQGWRRERLKRLVYGQSVVDKEKDATGIYAEIDAHVRSLLSAPQVLAVVKNDYELLRPALMITGLDALLGLPFPDKRASDRMFLAELNIDWRVESQRNLAEYFGGFWYIYRLSTSEERYQDGRDINVSLLSFKPTIHPIRAHDGGGIVQEQTLVPHFSMRSKFADPAPQIFRGRVFQVDHVLYFVGDKGRDAMRPKIFVMAWSVPDGSRGMGQSRMPKAIRGIITTVSEQNQTLTGPIVAQFIQTVEPAASVQEIRRKHPDGADQFIMDWYNKQIEDLSTNVRRHNEDDIAEILSKYNVSSKMAETISSLREQLASGGYYPC